MSAQNETIITAFYTALQACDVESMLQYYHDEVVFSDPLIDELKGIEAKNMWRLLLSGGPTTLNVEFEVKEVSAETASVQWISRYNFPVTGKQVENHVSSTIHIDNGLIIRHNDDYDVKKLMSMGMGPMAAMISGNAFLKDKIKDSLLEKIRNFDK